MRFAYYQRLTPQQQSVYRASDAIGTAPIPEGAPLAPMVAHIGAALKAADRGRLQAACQVLVDELCRRFAVPRAKVMVHATRPLLRGGDDLQGLYEPAENGKPIAISVWMRTARRRQLVAFRTFLRTLVHEFCHHLDYELFMLSETFHTEGFYRRESSLMSQLFPEP